MLEETDFSLNFDFHSLSLVFSHFTQNEIWSQIRMLKEMFWSLNASNIVWNEL